ncbi:Ribosome biogenesis protein Nop16 [Novymonas esmeraldas]|uniref:Nucleolar protein 16 n=1 Tax=Novymonas esmeraldas TaxID=1808958 RepID=A0AAW0ELZ9_9TRYP
MGRIKVTPKGKVKRNIPITRVGKKQYLKRRFAHVRAVDVAGANNRFTQKYFEGNHTAEQTFTRLGLAIDPSAAKSTTEKRKAKVRPHTRRAFDEQSELAEHRARVVATKVGRPVSEQEGSTIANLIQRYGTDLKRMTLDHKLNPFQLNVRQLQRQIVNYLTWEKAAFPQEFAEAEEKGWFSVEAYADPHLRSSQRT